MDLSSSDLAALKAEAQALPAALQVGKSGLTEGVVEEIKARLKRDRLVKIRLLKASRAETGRHELADELAAKTESILVETRGNTVVLYRPKGRRRRPAAPPPE